MKILQISYHTSPLANLGLNDGGGLSTYVHELSNVVSVNNSLIVITSENSKNKKSNLYDINTYAPLASDVGMKEKIDNLEKLLVQQQGQGSACTDDIVPSVQVLKHRQTQLEEAISENGGSSLAQNPSC